MAIIQVGYGWQIQGEGKTRVGVGWGAPEGWGYISRLKLDAWTGPGTEAGTRHGSCSLSDGSYERKVIASRENREPAVQDMVTEGIYVTSRMMM